MNSIIAKEILEEGIDILYETLGPIKAVKFFQIIGKPKGDSIAELEQKTESMSKEEVLGLVEKTRKEKEQLWKKLGLV